MSLDIREHKKTVSCIMSSSELDDDVRHSDVVVLEQPHRNVGHSIALVSGDSTEETTAICGGMETKNLTSCTEGRWMSLATHRPLYVA